MYQKLIIISLYAICFVTSCTSNYELGSSKYTSKVPKGMTAFEVMQIFGARGEDSFTKKEIKYFKLKNKTFLGEKPFLKTDFYNFLKTIKEIKEANPKL